VHSSSNNNSNNKQPELLRDSNHPPAAYMDSRAHKRNNDFSPSSNSSRDFQRDQEPRRGVRKIMRIDQALGQQVVRIDLPAEPHQPGFREGLMWREPDLAAGTNRRSATDHLVRGQREPDSADRCVVQLLLLPLPAPLPRGQGILGEAVQILQSGWFSFSLFSPLPLPSLFNFFCVPSAYNTLIHRNMFSHPLLLLLSLSFLYGRGSLFGILEADCRYLLFQTHKRRAEEAG